MSMIRPTSAQDLLDIDGFIVVAFDDSREFSDSLARGYILTDNWLGFLRDVRPYPRVIGVASKEDYLRQVRLLGFEATRFAHASGYLKVTAE